MSDELRQRIKQLETEAAQYRAAINRCKLGIKEIQARDAVRDELTQLGIKHRGKDYPKLRAALGDMDMSAVTVDDKGRVLGARAEAQRIRNEYPEFFLPGHRNREESMKTEIAKKAAELGRRVEEARNTYNREIGSIYHKMADGEMVPRYDEGRVQEIEQRARNQRADTLREIEAAANELMAEVISAEERLLDYSPTAILGAGDRQAAAELLPLVTAEAMALDSGALAKRIEHLLDSGEPIAAKYCYHVAGLQRRRSILESRTGGSGPRRPGSTSDTLTPLDEPLARLGERLFAAENERRTSEMKAARESVEAVLGAAYLLRNDARDAFGVHAKNYHRPPGGGPRFAPMPARR